MREEIEKIIEAHTLYLGEQEATDQILTLLDKEIRKARYELAYNLKSIEYPPSGKEWHFNDGTWTNNITELEGAMKNFLEMPDDQKKKIIKKAVHESNWAQVKVLYKKDLDKEIQKAVEGIVPPTKVVTQSAATLNHTLEAFGYNQCRQDILARIKQLGEGK